MQDPAEIPYTGRCETDLTAPDPFADVQAHQDAGGRIAPNPDNDLLVDCTIPDSDIGGESVSLVNVCTYPAGPPNSDAKDCVVSPGDGFLIVEKQLLDGEDDTFDFTLDGEPIESVTTSGAPVRPIRLL